jgi:hypothetical protein
MDIIFGFICSVQWKALFVVAVTAVEPIKKTFWNLFWNISGNLRIRVGQGFRMVIM